MGLSRDERLTKLLQENQTLLDVIENNAATKLPEDERASTADDESAASSLGSLQQIYLLNGQIEKLNDAFNRQIREFNKNDHAILTLPDDKHHSASDCQLDRTT